LFIWARIENRRYHTKSTRILFSKKNNAASNRPSTKKASLNDATTIQTILPQLELYEGLLAVKVSSGHVEA
jgi:hypothetical protein